MFKRVLLCYDRSEEGRRALKRTAELAVLAKAPVFVLSVVPAAVANAAIVAGMSGTSCLVDYESDYQRWLNESVEWLKACGIPAQGCLVRGPIVDAIVTCARRIGSDLVVVGHYPSSTGGWWSGSDRTSLAERLNCCVLIAASD